MAEPLRWGILGAAKFAREHMAPAIHAARGAELSALATSDPAKAEPFAAFAPGLKVFGSYEDLLSDNSIDAVYVPLPNHLHTEFAIKAMDAGKHVLVEKPLGLRASDFDAVITKRDETGLLAAEAYMIVHHPQWHRARDIIQSGMIGEIVAADGSFSYNLPAQNGNIRNSPETGGGALPDIGVYTLGCVRYVTGLEPQSVPYAKIRRENDVDVHSTMTLEFDGFLYQSAVSMRAFPRQQVVFHGNKGILRVTCPFNANVFDQAELILETQPGQRVVERFAGVNQYTLQVENFGRTVRDGVSYPCPLEFSKGTQAVIDMVFASDGKGS